MDTDQLRAKFRGALLGVLVGDAFGAEFEWRDVVRRRELDRALAGADLLQYTDDTHMTIGLAESLLACRGFDGPHLAATFARHFRAEPWRGYAAGPPRIFAAIEDGAAWDGPAATLFGGTGSFGNGAAMRVAPAALFAYPNLEETAALARQTSRVTHTHPLGVEGAVFQAVGVSLALGEQPGQPLDSVRFLERLADGLTDPTYQAGLTEIRTLLPTAEPRDVVRRLGHGVEAQSSVPTALYAFLRSPESFVDTICFAVSLGGDTDTIAAMAGALSGAYLGEEAIPSSLLARTEGVETLRGLADGLFEAAVGR